MGYFDTKEGVDRYIEMIEGYDGRALIDEFKRHVPLGSTVLELGMGPGTDLDLLRADYRVTGSDSSQEFVGRYRARAPEADVLVLDAVSIETTRRFDAVFSNKVLQHLTLEEVRESIASQHRVLQESGLAFHSLWYGEEYEEHHGLRFQQYTEESFGALVKGSFEILESTRYAEETDGDSIYFVLRKIG